jgi:protein TonB
MMSKMESKKNTNGKILIGMLLAVCLIAVFACDQKKLAKSKTSQINSEQLEEKVYEKVEQMPEFPGGVLELRKFLATSVRYPVDAQLKQIQGKVFVSFVIGKDGSVKNVKIARGVDPLLDAEALRVVNSMPKWSPGKNKGKTVAVGFTLPITFAFR